jgi:membrane-associated phospholipid phosphatase
MTDASTAASTDAGNAFALGWAAVAVLGIAAFGALAALGVAASPSTVSLPLVLLAAGLAAFHLRLRPIPRLAAGAGAFLQFMLILPFAMLLSFAAAAGGAPFQDGLLLSADRAIGFDWMAYARWIDGSPALALALRAAYISFLVQPLALIAVLAASGELRRLHLFTSAWTLCLLVTCLAFVFVPAVSVYAHLDVPPGSFENIRPVSTFQHLDFIERMRAGTLGTVDPWKGAGLITFPSFHACGAVLLAWGFWGVRAARWPGLVLNLAMIAATPVDGAHYLVDVIAGILLAFAGIAAAKALEPRVGPPLAAALARIAERARPAPAAIA